MAIEFKLPELGENIETGDVVRVLVSVGDTVAADQPVVEIETDKATVEVPAPAAGVVTDVAVSAGDTIAVGQPILTIASADGGDEEASEAAPEASDPAPVEPPEAPAVTEPEPVAVSSPRAAVTPPPAPTDTPTGGLRRRVLAAPSVRRLAREFGVDIAEVEGSGSRGRVTAADVKAHTRRLMTQLRDHGAVSTSPAIELPDFETWGKVERVRMTSVRRATARQMSRAWREVPHVTQHDRADITAFETVRRSLKKSRPDLPLTVTAYAVKVLAAALSEFPQFNASLDMTREEVVYKKYTHIGIAVDTDRGLLVPVLRDVDQKSLSAISQEIAELAEKARARKVTLDDLRGGTFTVTNLGGLGGSFFTPIINHPEVAILGLSRATPQPVLVDGAFQPRTLMPLSLSYDHRLIDGADAVRFLRWVAERIEQPLLLSIDS